MKITDKDKSLMFPSDSHHLSASFSYASMHTYVDLRVFEKFLVPNVHEERDHAALQRFSRCKPDRPSQARVVEQYFTYSSSIGMQLACL